jgi:prepilin-type processing-associated H-X9-DG protein
VYAQANQIIIVGQRITDNRETSMTDNPYASPGPENNPAPLKTQWKFGLFHLLSIVVIGGVAFVLLLPVQRNVPRAAKRTQCKNNIKQIGLALHNYHDHYGTFPPAYTVDSNGKRLHSWRTLILPYLDQGELFKRIDLAKAWDDPVNAEAAKTVLHFYHCPSAPGPNTHTSYMVPIGTHTCFPGATSKSISEITDGTSNSVVVVEVDAEKSVPWMSPTDVDEQFLLSLGPKSKASHTGGLNTLLADGSVRFLSFNLDEKVRRALMTIDVGDTVGEF